MSMQKIIDFISFLVNIFNKKLIVKVEISIFLYKIQF